ncbi:hypothetical protein C351_04511 [Cryptococcus neoformans c8]|nr:hypothetical protein C353_04629 [Cryptococcus neoformans var. grubii AD1-83a]OXG55332.1 hypothetical protein C354_04563 [Cryptococcus neoformans var. grubii MW-RSA1955]OXG58568.1 hypothetical protein C352_04547 [Cryptococcus neoformans var. grubii CHC193]OXG60979.1 hypothetical protein C351_04511 [Cryptococcus neoformans var. grubii c8]OXH07151.1 hypothetical protein C369_04605 [Cryptococcus neoformans var. grubii A5-35-17]OXH08725.1 hypothetical protein C370_04680 [Cryptococcus neoformans 
MSSSPEPTALTDPASYLCLFKFNRRLPRCPRTNLPVTFSDIGDSTGIPLLYLLPSGCSRWIGASLDPLAAKFGVRMIVIDRPGCGGTGQVPLEERIERSCEMAVSVLESLMIKPAHILVSSAGIYYALHLLIHHPSAFKTSLNPPPRLYLIAPWVPLLPIDHPESWPFKWDWIPTPFIATQHITTPHLLKAAEQAQKAYDRGLKAIGASRSFVMKMYKSFTEVSSSASYPSAEATAAPSMSSSTPYEQTNIKPGMKEDVQQSLNNIMGVGMGEGTEVQVPQSEGEGGKKERYWGPTPCCVTCLVSGYMQAENGQGIGQDHLLCLNRGPRDTGGEWLQTALSDLAATIQFAQEALVPETAAEKLARNSLQTGQANEADETGTTGHVNAVEYPLEIHVWWGWMDDMVVRKGQLFFNQLVGEYSGVIDLLVHDVPDGDHSDLMSRPEGIHQCFELIRSQNDTTMPSRQL